MTILGTSTRSRRQLLPSGKDNSARPRPKFTTSTSTGDGAERKSQQSRGVQVSTADGYIADAIRAGKAYRFGVLGVTRRTLSLVENAWHRHRRTIDAEAQHTVTPPLALQENTDADSAVHRRTIRAVKDILMEQAPGLNISWAECDFSLCHLQRLELLAAGDAASRLQLISPLPPKR